MAELVVPDDVLEKIIIGLDVKELIRCKSVCKSWHSFISSSRFVKAQLTYSYNNDRNNMEFGNRRIVIPMYSLKNYYHRVDDSFVGSSNGLVCISPSQYHVLVVNPSTREVKKLENPVIPHFVSWSCLCWGFGYDKSIDDYKVIVGFYLSNCRTRFQVLSLKSNVWKDIGEVNLASTLSTLHGTFCNGALHWLMRNQWDTEVIVSVDLSREKFENIPTPNYNVGYQYAFTNTLGVFEERLCIYCPYDRTDRWVMKNSKVRESWELLPYVPEKDKDLVCYLKKLEDYIPHTSFVIHDCITNSGGWEYICAPVFVQSLVSPHMCTRILGKFDACN